MICQLVLEYFQLQLSDILFFLEAFGLFGIFWPSKGLTAFLRPKNPKKASGLQKKPNVFKLQLKILQKKLTHHEKMPAFFLSLVPYHIDAHSSMILYITPLYYILKYTKTTLRHTWWDLKGSQKVIRWLSWPILPRAKQAECQRWARCIWKSHGSHFLARKWKSMWKSHILSNFDFMKKILVSYDFFDFV